MNNRIHSTSTPDFPSDPRANSQAFGSWRRSFLLELGSWRKAVRLAVGTCAVLAAAALCAAPALAQEQAPNTPLPTDVPFVTVDQDIAGYWTDLFHEDLWDRRSGLLVGDFTGLPLNDAGKLAGASWDPGWFAIPEEQCRPHTGIYGLRGPTGLQIAKVTDPLTYQTVRYDLLLGLSERTIWMDGRPHPPEYAPHTFAGFSTGRWEGNTLKVTTTHVKAGYLQRNGPPHSDQAVTTEWFTRQGDTLMLIALIDDPGYLSEGLMRTTNWALDKTVQRGGGRGQVDCGPFQVADERGGQKKHFVPHYLPGNYEAAKEFQQMYGIPQETAFGGAETLYPEYMAKFEKMREAYLRPAAAKSTAARTPAGRPRGFVGEWRLNRGKSTFEVSWRREGLDGRDGSAPERRILRVVQGTDGQMSFTIDTQIVANDTGFHRVEYAARFDTKDYPSKGGAVETFALNRLDERTFERTGKIKGMVVETGTWKLSEDGTTLTITQKGSVDGATYTNTQVFDRVGE
jgi:hypothetical protein